MMHENREIAGLLEDIADLLESREADAHRTRAYRSAARNILDHDRSLAELFAEGGEDALRRVRGVGEGIAAVVADYLRSGRSALRDDLAADVDPVRLIRRLPGIHDELSRRIVDQLNVRSLEELELAAHDGRLSRVKGFGPARVQAVKDVLGARLSRSGRGAKEERGGKAEPPEGAGPPPVSVLLDLDREYRSKAEAGELKTIAPRRFNPEGEAWLPVMKTKRGGWSFSVLFSNTARAHERGKTRDWAVIYYRRDGREGQCTVTTGRRGRLEGRRVVRGRERECREYYAE